jgi:hypothetical protein
VDFKSNDRLVLGENLRREAHGGAHSVQV